MSNTESFVLIVPNDNGAIIKTPSLSLYFTALERTMQLCCRACTIAVMRLSSDMATLMSVA